MIIWNFKMSNNNSPIKMSTCTNCLGQVYNKIFNKTSHKQVKYSKNITYCYYHTITLCHVQVMKFNWYSWYSNDISNISTMYCLWILQLSWPLATSFNQLHFGTVAQHHQLRNSFFLFAICYVFVEIEETLSTWPKLIFDLLNTTPCYLLWQYKPGLLKFPGSGIVTLRT